jgi:hypothetical protein
MVGQPGPIWALGPVGRDSHQVAETSRFLTTIAVSVRLDAGIASELKAAFLAVSLSVAEVPILLQKLYRATLIRRGVQRRSVESFQPGS